MFDRLCIHLCYDYYYYYFFFFEEKVGEKLSGTQDRDPGTCDPWTRYPVNQNSETGTLEHGTLTPRTPELGPWNLGYVTLKPRILRVGPWELNLWHRFLVSRLGPQVVLNLIMKHNFDNKKLGHPSRKLRGSSRWTKTFTKIFWHLA